MEQPGLPPPGAEGSIQRVTPQDVERAKVEKKAAFTRLMDEMEGSVETQGEYFVKLGQKKPITEVRQETRSQFMGLKKTTSDREETVGYDDNRALILKATTTRESYGTDIEEFYVVTSDGIYIIPFYPDQKIDNPQGYSAQSKKRDYDTLKALTAGKKTPDDSSGFNGSTATYCDDPAIESSHGFDATQEKSPWPARIPLEEPYSSTLSEDFHRAVQESISMTESPYKKNLEEAMQQIQVATGAADMIHSLPPRE